MAVAQGVACLGQPSTPPLVQGGKPLPHPADPRHSPASGDVTAHAFLTIVGRMTGRFLDENWFRTPDRAYGFPMVDTHA
ncbi:hypothetical protein [Nonomuraea jabiensis]|uniref:hypothetical protein n=1 Tax=Nonomuraea jabiensis TaxID=882448 RepID=UPI003D71EED0